MAHDIEVVWARVRTHEGEVFRQIRGQEFTYEVHPRYLIPSTTKWHISKEDFSTALTKVPLRNTVPVQGLMGPSYIYAILMDERIRQGDW